MGACTASGMLLVAAALLHWIHWLSFAALIASRLILGIGESLGSTGATLWGITSAGHENTAKVISFNGISTYGAMALGAPLGVILDGQWGLASIGLLTVVVGAVSLALAWRKPPVPVVHGEHLPFAHVLGRVAPHGMGLALGGVCYSVLATFITLFYASRHWQGAALCLTAFGVAFIVARLLFIQTISHFGGFPVAMVCLSVESLGLLLLWQSHSPWMAMAGAALGGFGFSLVFPSIGVEAVKRVPVNKPRHRPRRVYRLRGRLLLPHRTNGRRGHWPLRLRQRLPVRFGQRAWCAGDRDCVATIARQAGRVGIARGLCGNPKIVAPVSRPAVLRASRPSGACPSQLRTISSPSPTTNEKGGFRPAALASRMPPSVFVASR